METVVVEQAACCGCRGSSATATFDYTRTTSTHTDTQTDRQTAPSHAPSKHIHDTRLTGAPASPTPPLIHPRSIYTQRPLTHIASRDDWRLRRYLVAYNTTTTDRCFLQFLPRDATLPRCMLWPCHNERRTPVFWCQRSC